MLTKLLRASATTLLLIASVVVIPARLVLADQVDPVYCDQRPIPGCIVRAGTPGEGRNTGAGRRGGGTTECHDSTGAVAPCYIEGRGSMGSDGCYYQHFDNAPPPAGSRGPGAWYVRSCHETVMNGPLGVPLGGTLVWLPDGAAPVSPEVLARQAVSRLNLPAPVIRINPPPPASQITFVPSWLWVDSSSWGSRSATASVPGLAVTATARATQLVFATGDGKTVICKGPGTEWKTGMDPASSSPSCGHTYGAPGAFTLRATVTWIVSWTGGGTSGTVPPLTTTASVTIPVDERPAVNIGQTR